MLKLIVFISNIIILWLRLLLPGGVRKVAAENVALRKQLITASRHVKRSQKLTTIDKILFGILTSMISTKRLSRIDQIKA